MYKYIIKLLTNFVNFFFFRGDLGELKRPNAWPTGKAFGDATLGQGSFGT